MIHTHFDLPPSGTCINGCFVFRGHPSNFKVIWTKNWWFKSNLSKIARLVTAIKSLRFTLLFCSISWSQCLLIEFGKHYQQFCLHMLIKSLTYVCISKLNCHYTPTQQSGYIGFTPSRLASCCGFLHSKIHPSVHLSVCPACRVCSVTPTVLDGFFPYVAQMITSMRCNDLWPWPVSSRSFSHDFAIKLLKYGTSCCVCSTACTVLDGFSPYLAQMITSITGCVVFNDPWPWLISSRSFSYDFAIKLLKYDTSWHVQFWLDSFPIWYKWSLAWEGMTIGQRSKSHRLFKFLQLGWG